MSCIGRRHQVRLVCLLSPMTFLPSSSLPINGDVTCTAGTASSVGKAVEDAALVQMRTTGNDERDLTLVAHGQASNATKEFTGVVFCTTRNAAPPFGGRFTPNALAYADYGCFCGAAGDGPCNAGTPVDATDKCCETHDADWTQRPAGTAPKGCDCTTQTYRWTCRGLGGGNFLATCLQPQPNECARHCCDVDTKFASCLKAAVPTQRNGRFHDFSDPNCKTCGPPTPAPTWKATPAPTWRP
eukprot:TRINITY_DN5326_c0_g2_i6.p1 TRINITY_DN5326_c0_g2~~TRINITY_DN5326_c0_g2_i6.p1  ORF type:complete len:242 (-),score=25.90 TRINITY_DN5326_c0_g2_i6:310-1035(-)